MYTALVVCCFAAALTAVDAFRTAAFQATNWVVDSPHNNHVHKFVVSLGLRNRDLLKQEFLDVSNPKHESYGKYLSLEDLRLKYSPTSDDVMMVSDFFGAISGSEVSLNAKGDALSVVARAGHIEHHLGTSLMWHKHVSDKSDKRSLRTTSPLSRFPASIAEKISFVSLNSPINHMLPSARDQLEAMKSEDGEESFPVSVIPGNIEAIVKFRPMCGNSSFSVANSVSPPCSNMPAEDIPKFTVTVTAQSSDTAESFLLNTDPIVVELVQEYIFCYNNITKSACNVGEEGSCTCMAKVSPLPMYTQLTATITATLSSGESTSLGGSALFVLTDVATVNFLSELYNIPAGMKVNNKDATQGVAEFYGEFYSNADLEQFLRFSGLPNAEIPVENILYGYNNESEPGGEAQLDVEYLMALAPGAPTYFYSVKELNPADSENEGFLTWLLLVGSEDNPPLVQSLSYADNEVSVFLSNNQSAYDYGTRCDEEFMQLGLRGVTILVASGDDGLGGTDIRSNISRACSQAWPTWPSSSPYITSIGATQLTDQYIPGCGQPYSSGMSTGSGIPPETELLFQCSGTRETVCSASTGGVITSGGGFSNVNMRASTASWQIDAVNGYLEQKGAYPSSPGYFNTAGRGYPDVSTYGSNYFVYIDGQLTRESGTSASTPVFAAMVTLWNDIRFTYGLPPMGFINPFLYQAWSTTPEAFNDIVTGNNACGVGHSTEDTPCCEESFSAVSGWDAVTGLGSPNFAVISSLVINPNSSFPAIGPYPDGEYYKDKDKNALSKKYYRLSGFALVIAIIGLFIATYVIYGIVIYEGDVKDTRKSLYNSVARSDFALI